MIFKRIESKGISQYSYIVGDRNEAAVIDPRRDCYIYANIARSDGMSITKILETHRHEDFIVGSKGLGEMTGADIIHADGHLNYSYGSAGKDGERFHIGRLEIEVMDTPGHTIDSKSYLLYDPDGNPWMIFTGDAIFAGDVGRVDFMGSDRLEEMAGMLYDSIHKRILSHDEGTILCPAHGAGSVCAETIAERTWTTIGLEKKLNPRIAGNDKKGFIEGVAKELEHPPYFKMMEKMNLVGMNAPGKLKPPLAMSPKQFRGALGDAFVIDSRMELGFGSAHVPGALSMWTDGIPRFAGWFVPYDKDILLVSEPCDVQRTIRYLRRFGYDRIIGYLSKGMTPWHTSGNVSEHIPTTTVQDLCSSIDGGNEDYVLDVRGSNELDKEGRIPNSKHIHLTQLEKRTNELPKDRRIHIFCGSGLRSMIAASLLKKKGWNDLVVMLGGISSWNSLTCPLEI